ncbi:MAG: bifunctional folylpolyglutamate synthase/dihydrofolate synthase [Acidobacteriota bacterium]|nr:bifunctional folylpolyglutamate synthase/dihydrofolate synthase [Acidobacteriota bacterium]
MSYPDSVRYLYALGNELKVGAKWGLERMRTLLEELGNPERGQRFVHVAGTNGKGSTCAMIASVLRHAGLRTGLNTSPHLSEPTERIQIDGQAISDDEFSRVFEVVHAAAEKLLEEGRIDGHPSYFETVTAMALLVFHDRCEISVIEVGLGGRLDATNVIAPALTVITPIAFDHESFLGNTIELIASEKAGIIKAGVAVVSSRQSDAAEVVINERARELGCRVVRAADAEIADVSATAYGSSFVLDGAPYECSLPGRHQIENAVAAILACRELGIENEAIQKGLGNARWPGRLELVSRNPDFVLDGAHNPAGAQALASYIREFCSDRPVWIVYGAMRDKAIEEVTAQLFPLADRLILTAPDFSRALRPGAILVAHEHSDAVIAATVEDAIEAARSAPHHTVVFFTGSLYLVGQARELLVGKD